MDYLALDRRWVGLLTAAFGAVLLSSGGCGDDDTEGEESTADESVDVSTLEDPEQARDIVYAEAYCGCYSESDGYDDEASCIDANNGFSTEACIADALFDNDAAKDRLQCLYEASVAEAECITSSECGEQSSVSTDCNDIKRGLIADCPSYPDAVQTAVADCTQPEPFWAVGDGGMVFGVDADGSSAPESLPLSSDLRGIACDGAERAWVVGDAGVTLRTEDAGAQWVVTTIPADLSLRAVAQSHGTDVAAVGDNGAFVLSSDGGVNWSEVSAPSESLTGVAAAAEGAWLITSAEGSIFLREPGGVLARVYAEAGAGLLAVAADHHSPAAAAVGEEGTLVLSDDGGRSWSAFETSTDRTLHAVNVLGPQVALAVGERGTIVRLDEQGLQINAFGPQTLFGLHVTADGTGGAVGERGRLLETADGGRTWRAKSIAIDTDLRGLDQPLVQH